MKQIYVIKNIVNDKVYVGQTDDAFTRFRRHRNNLTSTKKVDMKIVKAMREIGVENFYYVLLENCEDDVADEREIYYIDKFNSFKNGYNATIGGSKLCYYTKEDIDQCEEMFLNGEMVVDIEEKTGIEHRIIKRELQKRIPDYDKIVAKHIAKSVSAAKSKPVLQYDLEGNLLKRFNNVREALLSVGANPGVTSISNCCKHRKHYNSAYGYKWEYDTQ